MMDRDSEHKLKVVFITFLLIETNTDFNASLYCQAQSQLQLSWNSLFICQFVDDNLYFFCIWKKTLKNLSDGRDPFYFIDGTNHDYFKSQVDVKLFCNWMKTSILFYFQLEIDILQSERGHP